MLLLQERHLEQLLAGPVLSDEERDVIRWGNNAKISIPRRFGKSGTHAKTYRAATAMECLVSCVKGSYIALCASSPFSGGKKVICSEYVSQDANGVADWLLVFDRHAALARAHDLLGLWSEAHSQYKHTCSC